MYKVLFLSLLPLFLFANISQDESSFIIEQALEDSSLEIQRIKKVNFEKNAKTEIKKLLKKRNPSKLSKKQTYLYYRYNNYLPFFVNEHGIKQLSYDLIDNIKEDQVLKPYAQKLFKLKEIEERFSKIDLNNPETNKELINLDFTLTSIYHQYMRYLAKGFINWEAFEKKLEKLNKEKEIIANWRKYDVRKNIRKLLYKAVEENDITYAINKVNYNFPKSNEFATLIKEYEGIANAGGYTKIPRLRQSLRFGNYYSQVKELRIRLFESKDIKNPNCLEKVKNCLELYDENLFQAVKSFQKRHGLKDDGIIGSQTIKKLNMPIENKIKKMRVNLERMRWMPRTLGEKFLLVNIPEYKLKMYQEGKIKLDMAVVVGEYKNPTPIFSNKLSSIVINPYWRIPQSIVKKEIIPKLIENPNYLKSQGVNIHENWDHNSLVFNPEDFDWIDFLDNDLIGTSAQAPMRFIQEPNEKNPLGRVKFLFPNGYSVYLHDTPQKHFFKYNKRAYSHGCIRIERPYELLETIANEDENIDFDLAKDILKDIQRTDFSLKKTIPVHLVYLTSWVDEKGKVHFREDIYDFDKMQGEILYKSL